MKNTNIYALSGHGWDIDICPNHGAAILSCRYQGQDILRSAPSHWCETVNMFEASHFPLLPYSNRIANGQFEFEGRKINITPNTPGQTHPLHGFGWYTSWDVIEQTATYIDLRLKHVRQDEIWPWSLEAKHSVRLHPNCLILKLSITNTDDMPFPVGLGFHPYFTNVDQLSFEANLSHIQLTNDQNIPKADALKMIDYMSGQTVRTCDLLVDNCFVGAANGTLIRWKDRKTSITLTTSDNLPFTVIYSDPAKKEFCLEPVTHLNNAVNMDAPYTETGLKILRPGQTYDISLRLRTGS